MSSSNEFTAMISPFGETDTAAAWLLRGISHSREDQDRVAKEIDDMRREYHKRALYELLDDLRRYRPTPKAL